MELQVHSSVQFCLNSVIKDSAFIYGIIKGQKGSFKFFCFTRLCFLGEILCPCEAGQWGSQKAGMCPGFDLLPP